MKIKILFLAAMFFCSVASIFAQMETVPRVVREALADNYRSWKIAPVSDEISDHFKKRRSGEIPNIARGDWNGDRRIDYAFLMQSRQNTERKIIVAVSRLRNGISTYFVDEAAVTDCLMSEKKGQTGYDYETKRKFRYPSDAIFSYIWEKAGTSYFWRNGRFRGIATSD